MFGDSATRLHKHEHSISWDTVLVCNVGSPIADFDLDSASIEDTDAFADGWRRKLNEGGHDLSAGDLINLRHVGRLLSAFKVPALGSSSGRERPRRAAPAVARQ